MSALLPDMNCTVIVFIATSTREKIVNHQLTVQWLALGMATVLLAFPAKAQDSEPEAAAKEKLKAERLEYMISSAKSIDLRVAVPARQTPVKARWQGPVQRWSHPISPPVPDATVFVWTLDERPVAAAQIFFLDGFENWSQEFSALTAHPLTAAQTGAPFWATEGGAVKSISIEGTVAPRENLRLVQMRRIARQFEAVNKADQDSPNQLHLLPTPLYRFSSSDAQILDGALFSLASGIDPEVLLLIEAHQSGQSHRWQVTFAPMTIFACRVNHEQRQVWSVPYRQPPHALDSPFMYHHDTLPNQPIPGK
jgi:hypothetical protein